MKQARTWLLHVEQKRMKPNEGADTLYEASVR
jgi:hypothetical protein